MSHLLLFKLYNVGLTYLVFDCHKFMELKLKQLDLKLYSFLLDINT